MLLFHSLNKLLLGNRCYDVRDRVPRGRTSGRDVSDAELARGSYRSNLSQVSKFDASASPGLVLANVS